MTKSSNLPKKWVNKPLFAALLIFTFILYLNLGRDALFDWDEGIYAELGAELLATKNLFVSFWDGSVWFEKPPGIAWLSGLGQLLAGHTPLGARLFQPLVASAVLYLVYLIGRRLHSWRTGILAAAILAGFNLFLGRTRAVNTDMPLLLGVTGTVAALLYNKKPILVALIIALSVWFKGPAGLLPILIAFPLFITKSKTYLLHAVSYTLCFILPWHLFAYFAYGDTFLTPYFREQVLTRAITQIEFHFESRWFYFQYLYENLGLGVLLVSGLGAALALKSKKWLPVWWLVLPLGLFTLAKTRIFWYILPVYPALALLAAYAIDYFATSPRSRQIVTILALLICLQSISTAWRSVEPSKKSVEIPDRLQVASALSPYQANTLAVLVPLSERTAEAILPMDQRLSSSFRYGGMPSVVYYYRGHVQFFYNVDEFITYWQSTVNPLALVHQADLARLPSGYRVEKETAEYFGLTKGIYAQR